MDNNDFLATIEKGKERLTDANRSKEDCWFSGSMAMLEACLAEVWNTARKDTIPIEWLKQWEKKHKDDPCYCGFISEEILADWERENGTGN